MALKLPDHTRIPHSLVELMYSGRLDCAEMRVMLFLLRHTLGWDRREYTCHQNEIAKACDTCRQTVNRAIQRGKEMGWLDSEGTTYRLVYEAEEGCRVETTPSQSGCRVETTPSQSGCRAHATEGVAPTRQVSDSLLISEKENKERGSPLPPSDDPDPELRIDRWIEETAKAAGKACARFGKKEREHLIASDTPELRDDLGASIRCTLSSEVSDVVLQVAAFDRQKRHARSPMPRTGFQSRHLTTRPDPKVSPPEVALRSYLEENGFDFTGCDPVKSWIADIVLTFKNEAPGHFESAVLPTALKVSGGIGSTGIQSCYSIISGYDKSKRDWLREVK